MKDGNKIRLYSIDYKSFKKALKGLRVYREYYNCIK